MNGVSKRFRKGEVFDSLRDVLPALTGKLIERRRRGAPSPREFWALKDISFSVARGEAVGIIGHNGAGKSTILKLLSRLIKPTNGTIETYGSLSALIEVGAGFHPDLTGRENIYLNGAILGLSRAEVTRKFDQIVEFSGLAEFLDTPVKRYSTGMYARLGFSVAAHVDSEILIVDEVLSVGDYMFQKRCLERMRDIVAQGSATVFVSHNLDAVATFCNRAILLDHGRVVEEGEPQEVIEAYMELGRIKPTEVQATEAFVSRVVIRDQDGPRTRFQTGDDVWIEVDVTANKRCERLSLAVYLRNERNVETFFASTVRLGIPPVTVDAGETKTFTVHLTLHLVGGTFELGTLVYRNDLTLTKSPEGSALLGQKYDDRFPIGTLLVAAPIDLGGVANLYPEFEVTDAPSSTCCSRRLPQPAM